MCAVMKKPGDSRMKCGELAILMEITQRALLPDDRVAALVCKFHAMRHFERTMHAICHSVSEPGGLMNTHIGPFSWFGLHNERRPGVIGKLVMAKTTTIVLSRRCLLPDRRRHAAPLKSPATMSTSNRFLPIPRFLIECSSGVKLHRGKVGFTNFVVSSGKRHVR